MTLASDVRSYCIGQVDRERVHLTDAVAAKISSQGHIPIIHGGGTTAICQPIDTHLHAHSAHLWAMDERRRDLRPVA